MCDHVVFGEPGGMGAQPVFVVDQTVGDLVELDRPQIGLTPAHPTLQPGPDLETDVGGFGLPPPEQPLRGGGVVLVRPGRQ